MKRIIKTVAIATILSLTVVSCQKELAIEPQGNETEVCTVYTVRYAINGVPHCVTLYGDDALQMFIDQMLALAREGHEVSFSQRDSSQVVSSKEQIVYTTTSEQDANAWSLQKIREGFEVSIQYNPRTGVYTCTAIR